VPTCEEAPAEAYAVNATGVAALAESCARIGARLVHVSTDYVFGATPPTDASGAPRPWREDDAPAPLNVYAASKLAGEYLLAAACSNHAIVRSSGLYGEAPCLAKGGRNFVQLMLQLATERGEVKVVTDETLTPTATADLAEQIRVIAASDARGVFHATCQGICSWNEFAAAIFEESGTEVSLLPATSEDFPSPVRRPAYSALENARLRELGLDRLPHWREALRGYLETIGAAKNA
jgi:dTDP-4-dehydrorhamnose reductase